MVARSIPLLLFALAVAAGCRSSRQIRDPEYARVSYTVRNASCAPFEVALAPIDSSLVGPQPVEVYVAHALDQNADIQAARMQMEAFAHKVPVAASLPDPMLQVTAQPEPVQTAAGQQEALVSVSQKFVGRDRLGARASVAESQTNVARAELAAVELATIAQVKRAYYELYFLQQAIAVTESDQKLLAEIREVALTRYQTNNASQQDVLRADLEISGAEQQLIGLRQQLASMRARLARLLHVSPQTELAAVTTLGDHSAPLVLEHLQALAITARPELHAQLAALQRDRCSLELARLDYKPELTLGATWIDVAENGISPVANGRDAFLLSAGLNLPLYRKRLDSGVRSAEAQAVATARRYDSLRDSTLEEVTDLFSKAHSQEELLLLFREDILPKSRQTLEVSIRAYNVGEVDFLTLIDNWRQVLRYEVTYRRTEASLRQSLAELERVVGGFDASGAETNLTSIETPSLVEPTPAEANHAT